MIKKIKYIFLVFFCLFFISVSNVKANAIEHNTIYFNFDNTSFSDFLSTPVIDDTGVSYTNEQLLNILVDAFKDNYKFILTIQRVETSSDTYSFYVSIQQLLYTTTSASFKYSPSDYYLRLYPAGTIRFGQSSVLPNNNFNMTEFIQTWQNYINNDAYHGATNVTLSDINLRSSFETFPYFSNISYVWNDDDYNISITSKGSEFSISKGDTMEDMFFLVSSKTNYNFPIPTFEFSNVQTNSNNIVTSVDVTFDFKKQPLSNWLYQYSLNNGSTWNNLTSDNFVHTITLTSNTTLRARLNISDTSFNDRHIKVDFIGQSLDSYYDFLEKKYNSDYENEINSIHLSASSSVEDYLTYWYLQLKRTFPIIFQISDILNLFNSDKYNYITNELPNTTINLSFLGINQTVSIIDFTFFNQYREQAFDIIKIIAALYTFVAVQNILREGSKQT